VASLGRNDPCHCGSGKKYKHCHLDKDEAAARAARAKQAEEPAAAAAAEAAPAAAQKAKPPQTHQPWKRTQANTRGFARVSATRKVGGS